MLAQFYPPTVGGEETYVRNLSVALAQRGHAVSVATISNGSLPDFEICDGVRIYRMHGALERIPGLFSESGRKFAPPFPDPGIVWELKAIVQRERPEIVHAHNWIVRSFIPLKAWSGARLVMSLHDYSLICAKKNLMYKGAPCDGPAVAKCLACASDHYGTVKGVLTATTNWGMSIAEKAAVDMFLPVSQTVAEKDRLVNSNLPYRVMPNFLLDDVDAPSDDPCLKQLPDEPFLLFVGDLRRMKGVDVVVDAYRNLTTPPPLVLIGRDCPDTPDPLPPNVLKFSNWPHNAVMQAWSRCLMGLAPSAWYETFGYVVLEAMMMGRPVIGSRMGGIADLIVSGETGLLVPPGNVAALQEAIAYLLKYPEVREKMSIAAGKRAAQYRANVVVPCIESVFQECLDHH